MITVVATFKLEKPMTPAEGRSIFMSTAPRY
jgi:hypothetical protein